METVFNSLKSTGQNNVEGVITMMKNGMLAPGGEVEDYIRAVFSKTGNLKYDQFRELMSQVAKGLGIPIAEFGGQLTAAPMLHTADSNYDMDESPNPSQNESRSASFDDYNSPGQTDPEDSQDQETGDDDDGP